MTRTADLRDKKDGDTGESTLKHLPRPIVKKMRWPYPLIWLIPILAAIAASFYFISRFKDYGPVITLKLSDVAGLKAGDTPVSHLGVPVGKVIAIRLTADQKQPVVEVRLQRAAKAFAQNGAMFWVVKPQISGTSVSGLTTIMSGPYIEAIAGSGAEKSEFDVLPKAPTLLGDGLTIVLHAPRLEHVEPDSPVNYRGIQVGVIRSIQLSGDATGIDLHVFIEQRYSDLVRVDSKFWLVKGIDLKGGLFTGLQMQVDSLRSILTGGVTFATPSGRSELAVNEAQFPLYDEPKKEWLDWSPQIAVESSPGEQPEGKPSMPEPSDAVRSMVK